MEKERKFAGRLDLPDFRRMADLTCTLSLAIFMTVFSPSIANGLKLSFEYSSICVVVFGMIIFAPVKFVVENWLDLYFGAIS